MTVPLHVADGGKRLAFAFDTIRDEVRHALDLGRLPVPGFVFVEQPGSSTINWPLAYMVGVTQGAVYAGVLEHAPHGPCVETIPPASWKKRACGAGNIYKPTRKSLGRHPDFHDYPVALWAKELGYEGLDWNECDAYGIAEAARRTVHLDPR